MKRFIIASCFMLVSALSFSLKADPLFATSLSATSDGTTAGTASAARRTGDAYYLAIKNSLTNAINVQIATTSTGTLSSVTGARTLFSATITNSATAVFTNVPLYVDTVLMTVSNVPSLAITNTTTAILLLKQ